MNFQNNFLKYLSEAQSKGPVKMGTSLAKETAMASAGDKKSRDAARKRAERSKAPKRTQLAATELVKQVVAVKTQDGASELIYKDSYNPNFHEIINAEKDLSIEDAKAITKDAGFIQTQASQQLFGDLKKKAEAKERERAKQEASGEPQGGKPEEEIEAGPEVEPKKFEKPKKLSVQDLLASMGAMDSVQMGSIPFELRQEFFMNNRDPMSDKDFDNMTFEAVAAKFGIAKVDIPYNEQVKNALIMLSRMKAGASDQELGFVTNLKGGAFTQFGREAFEQAKKILSGVGDECLQLMVSASEAGLSGVSPEGRTDFKCGNIKFAVNSQGEISLSSGDPTQQGKNVRKTIQRSLVQTMQDHTLADKDPIYKQAISSVNDVMAQSAPALISDESFKQLSKDPAMFAFMQSEPVISPTGENLGAMVLPSGELNPAISFKKFEDSMDRILDKFISQEKTNKAPFMRGLVQNTLANFVRGDGVVEPDAAPSHLVTSSGIFPLSNEYLASVANNSDIMVTKNNKVFGGKKDEISRYRTVIEQVEPAVDPMAQQQMDPYFEQRQTLQAALLPIPGTPIDAFATMLTKNYNFDMNVSMLPGVEPKDIHGVEYNYINVHGKKFKIPVQRDQELLAASFDESYAAANDLLLESLENDDVLRALYETDIIDFDGAENIVSARYGGLNECRDILISVMESMAQEIYEKPWLLAVCQKNLIEAKERKRNYKREYKLFHGKPSQIKKRAKRVTARRKMEEQGKVHKGDGKDVDHKHPLRKGGGNGKGNLRVRDRGENRSDNGKYKGQAPDKPRKDK